MTIIMWLVVGVWVSIRTLQRVFSKKFNKLDYRIMWGKVVVLAGSFIILAIPAALLGGWLSTTLDTDSTFYLSLRVILSLLVVVFSLLSMKKMTNIVEYIVYERDANKRMAARQADFAATLDRHRNRA